ncbi:30S ribosomal protein S5 [Planctomycetales bacterium ZRK34]|nr:30S ribosomal protein S5 [Planctomycetales bacterium ZRK34]
MAEFLEESGGLESTTIGIYRTAATVKGGRRFSFGALVVVGDRNGTVGLGYGKAPGVPAAIEKAQKAAKKNLQRVPRLEGTIPHEVMGRFLSSTVKLIPASPGTGVIAGGTVRAVLEMAGIRDCLTKSTGSNNQKNLSKAVMGGLLNLRSKADVEKLRGVKLESTHVEEILEAGRRFAPTSTSESTGPRGPQAFKPEKGKGRGGKGRGRGKGKPQRDDNSGGGTAVAEAPEKPATEAPAPEASSDEKPSE